MGNFSRCLESCSYRLEPQTIRFRSQTIRFFPQMSRFHSCWTIKEFSVLWGVGHRVGPFSQVTPRTIPLFIGVPRVMGWDVVTVVRNFGEVTLARQKQKNIKCFCFLLLCSLIRNFGEVTSTRQFKIKKTLKMLSLF